MTLCVHMALKGLLQTYYLQISPRRGKVTWTNNRLYIYTDLTPRQKATSGPGSYFVVWDAIHQQEHVRDLICPDGKTPYLYIDIKQPQPYFIMSQPLIIIIAGLGMSQVIANLQGHRLCPWNAAIFRTNKDPRAHFRIRQRSP